MTLRFFGTDGIRGIANQVPMTPEWLAGLGFRVGRVLEAHGIEGPVVLGRDTRRSSPWLAASAAAVLGANFDPSEFLGAGFDLAVLFRSMAGFG